MKPDLQLEPIDKADTVVSRANAGLPQKGELERMARRRYQNPDPELIGRWWYIRVWIDEFQGGQRVRVRKRVQLCSAEKKIREVRKIRDDYLKTINTGKQGVAGGVKLSDYIDKYYPAELRRLAAPTVNCYESMIEKHIRPALGEMCFREMTPYHLQSFFGDLDRNGVEYPTRTKVRDALSSILRSATRLEIIGSNPLLKVMAPPDRRGKRKKPVITPEQFNQIVAGISEPYATMVFVAVWTGLRVSELIGLKWRCIGVDTLTIEERYCRGDWSHPKSTASAATIGVYPDVIERINRLKDTVVTYRAGRATRKGLAVRACGPDDLVFQSVKDGKAMRDGNILRRHIKPAARAVGLEFVNWRSLRTSHATWLVQAGADPKSVQGQMRHARMSTTMDIYAQVVPEAQRIAIRKLAEFVPNDVPLLSQKIASFHGSKGAKVVSIR